MSKQKNSGDPRKQPRPDSEPNPHVETDQVTKAFPPNLSAIVTAVSAQVVPFMFPGGKAIDLTVYSGDMELHLHFTPETAEVVIDTIRQAKIKADTGLEIAHSLPNGDRVAA